tara:strand:+ start:732 stop:1124 length:393 start_codon:yes stop_codon:yes gene_type:complete
VDLFGVGIFEALLVLVVALIVVGPNKFPEIARSAGRWFTVARNYASEVRSDIESATAEIESEVMKEQEFIDGISEDLDTIEEETKGSMPKVIDMEPVFETNLNDFQEKDDEIEQADTTNEIEQADKSNNE